MKKIAFTYNVKHNEPSADLAQQEDLEFDSPLVIETIKKALTDLGHEVLPIEADLDAFEKLRKHKDDIAIVFNIAEGLDGDARESQIPLYCELLKIPYTHSSPTTHAITLDKRLTNMVLDAAGVRVPKGIVVEKKTDLDKFDLRFPVIIKPNKEGSSKGVFDKNVVGTMEEMLERLAYVSEDYTKEVTIEEFIDGREFTVSVMGNENPTVLPIVEQKFDFLPEGFNRIASFELKWMYEDRLDDLRDAYDCPAKLSPELQKEIEDTCKKVYALLKVRDCARIDYRLTDDGKLYFIEINTLPGINPDENAISYFPLAARTAGMTYHQLVTGILDAALTRLNIKL
jgi:D-alanine-D-alanine ligase